jgi:hypothetical protein
LAWPRILTHYDLTKLTTAGLLMERSPQVRSFALLPLSTTTAEMGQSVQVPASDDPLWVSIDVKPTLLEKAVEALYKPPVVSFTLRLADGDEEFFRLNPETAKAGFLLSPAIYDRFHFALLATPQWESEMSGERATSFIVDTGRGPGGCYGRDYDVTFQQLVYPHRDLADAAELQRLACFQDFVRLMHVWTPDAAWRLVPADSKGRTVLLTPGRMAASIPAPKGATSVHIEFGQDLPINSPRADGTHFRVGMANLNSAGQMVTSFVWERVLNPHSQPGDRGLQQADIELDRPPPGYILLDIQPGPDQPDIRGYWAAVEFH